MTSFYAEYQHYFTSIFSTDKCIFTAVTLSKCVKNLWPEHMNYFCYKVKCRNRNGD